jgi:WD40 repeat protein
MRKPWFLLGTFLTLTALVVAYLAISGRWLSSEPRLLKTLRGHTHPIGCVAFSPDGSLAASVDLGGAVKVWDATTGQEKKALSIQQGGGIDPEGWVEFPRLASSSSIAFSSDGNWLAAGAGAWVTIWNIPNGTKLRDLGLDGFPVRDLALSPDGTLLATATENKMEKGSVVPGKVRIWAVTTGQELVALQDEQPAGDPGHLRSVAFSPDGTRLASVRCIGWRTLTPEKGLIPGQIKVWDPRIGKELLQIRIYAEEVYCVAFSPNGTRLASLSSDNFRPDGRASYGGERLGRGSVQVWDATDGRELFTFPWFGSWGVKKVAFGPDGNLLISGRASQRLPWERPWGDGEELQVWHLASGQELLTLRGHESYITSLALSPDGRRLATCSDDKTVRIWDFTGIK